MIIIVRNGEGEGKTTTTTKTKTNKQTPTYKQRHVNTNRLTNTQKGTPL